MQKEDELENTIKTTKICDNNKILDICKFLITFKRPNYDNTSNIGNK